VDELAGLAAGHKRQLDKCEKNIALQFAVGKCLNEASISYVTLKGLYIAQHFFGDVRRRFMWDIDILVRSEDFHAAVAAMVPLGLLAREGISVDPCNPFWGIHAVEVRGPIGKLDIHQAIRVLPKVRFDYAKIWARARTFTLDGKSFPTLCDTDHLLAAAVGLGADIQTGHHNLRKIWDVYMMLWQLDESTDWTAFIAERREEGCLKLVLNVFAFCLLLLSAQEDCPRLWSILSAHQRLLLITSERHAARIFARGRQHIANRMLFSSMLPIPPIHYWLRWFVTLPVRLWHYRRTTPHR